MAGTSWPTLTAGAIARASDVNARDLWLEGSLVPMSQGSTTDGVHDLGTTTAYWRVGYMNSINATTTARGLAIGTTTVANASDVAVDIAGIRALLIPRLTTVQRTNLAGINGMLVYDSTLNAFQKYENGAWVNMGGPTLNMQPLAVTGTSWTVGTTATQNLISFTGSGRIRSLKLVHSSVGAGTRGILNVLANSTTVASYGFSGTTSLTLTAFNIDPSGAAGALAINFTGTAARMDLDMYFKSSLQIEMGSPSATLTITVYLDWEHE